MNDIEFIHLRLHTEYSLVDGTTRIKPLIKRAAELGMPAIAVTDQNNLFALVKFYRAAMGSGIKPIAGSDVLVFNSENPAQPFRLTLLAQNQQGYRTLCELVSLAYLEGQHQGVPMLTRQQILDQNDGLLALSGGPQGDVSVALMGGHPDQARALLKSWLNAFGDRYYLEIQRLGKPDEESHIDLVTQLATELNVPVVATNDVRFLHASDFEAHETRVCINQGRVLDDPRRPKTYTDQQYLRSAEEMQALFHDLPEALINTVHLAKRCNLGLTLGENFLPDFPIPGGLSVDDYLAQQSEQGLEKRIEETRERLGLTDETIQLYHQRLRRELDVICQMGFPGYFLIVADFIQWAKQNGVPVGPGRGSGAGSIVAYALRITDLDPIEFELLFERFLNPERVSMPDFDVDFCMEGRDRVIDYVAQRYGREKVSQIITFGSMAAKAVVRDVGRVLSHPYGFVDRLAKMIPFEIGMTLTKALETNPELKEAYDQEEEVEQLMDRAMSLEGLARNAGKHAGGVVIAPSRLTDFTPLYCEQGGGNLVTQFDKDDVEAAGLVKFDFLGLRTLTIIDWAIQTINTVQRVANLEPVNIDALPRDDAASFNLLKNGETTAVFQLESRGMKDLIRRLRPDCFEDIIALVALFRPGPLESGMVDDYINVKHGRRKIEYPHPTLEPILKPTNGVILYQEQVMQIAQDLAGYTLGGADLLRRAMGKKKPEEMAKQRAIFTEGAIKNGVEESTATYIFDLMEKFAGYGFNKSHSAAYALIAYQTAWLKAHFPAAFMAAVLSSDMDNTDKVVMLIEECHSMGLELLPPDVNQSNYRFTSISGQQIVYGLGAIKGVGSAAIDSILQERADHDSFESLDDFCRRIDLRKANKRVLEALIRSGALDGLNPNRAALMDCLPRVMRTAEQHGAMEKLGQNDLFGLTEAAAPVDAWSVKDDVEAWSEEVRLRGEKETLGLFLTGHPYDAYQDEFDQFSSGRLVELLEQPLKNGGGKGYGRRSAGKSVVVSGLIVDIRTRQTKKGTRMATIILDDRTARMEVVVYSETLETHREMLQVDRVVAIVGNLSFDDFAGSNRVVADQILTVEQARSRFASNLLIEWPTPMSNGKLLNQNEALQDLLCALKPYAGGECAVHIRFQDDKASAELVLGEAWHVQPSDDLLKKLQVVAGEQNQLMRYASEPNI